MVRRGVLLLSMLLPAAAAAAEFGVPSSGYWYVGAAIGMSRVEDFNSSDPRYDLLIGWRPWRYLALEGGYISLGRHDDPSAPDPVPRIDGFGGALLGLLPLDDRNLLLARLGLHKLDIEEGFEPSEVKLAHRRHRSGAIDRPARCTESGAAGVLRHHGPARSRQVSGDEPDGGRTLPILKSASRAHTSP